MKNEKFNFARRHVAAAAADITSIKHIRHDLNSIKKNGEKNVKKTLPPTRAQDSSHAEFLCFSFDCQEIG